MNKTYKLLIFIHLSLISVAPIHTESEKIADSNDSEQTFIAKRGKIGIYQPELKLAHIGNNNYKEVEAVFVEKDKRIKKPKKSVYLGRLIDGKKVYKLFGKDIDPVPVDNSPDGDVRTEQKIDEDFLSDFGSGKWTTDDKWD